MARSVWVIAALASACPASETQAQDQRFRVDVPAGALADALATLATQTGVSIGSSVPLGGRNADAVRGRMTVNEALRRTLARSGLRAQRVGPSTWRLDPLGSNPAPATPTPIPAPDVVVTGRKLVETLSRIPAAVAVYQPDAAGRRGSAAADAHDVAASVEGLSITNLGPGRDRPFIRGVADSPFNGFSQATVSVIVDDARVTYDAPEPGLRLVDIARVEVLKGPQGPLYGTGALGGVLRIVTNRPVLDAFDARGRADAMVVQAGGPGGGAEAIVNAPLLAGRAAVRLVGYATLVGGWVNDAGGRQDVNASSTVGARLALRAEPAADWTADVGGAIQRIAQRDSQYVDRDAEDLTRSARPAEPSSGLFRLVHATLEGPAAGGRLTLAASHAWQDRSETYAAAASAVALGRPDARTYRDRRTHRVFDVEARLASEPGQRLTWLAGASYLSATTSATGDLAGADQRYSPFFLLHRGVTETALFADVSAPLGGRLRIGAGGRLFRSTTDDERREEGGEPAAKARATLGFTPTASLSYEIAPDRLVYARLGSAFRPGGLDPTNIRTGRYDADEVRSVDAGTRLRLADGRLSISGGAFRSTWANVQSDYLQANGLVATRTAGDALIVGGEISVEWRPGPWTLRAGGVAQRARLDRGVDGTELAQDPRLPVVPDATARLEVGRAFDVAGARVDLHLAGDYVGNSRLSFDEGLDRRMGGYATASADAVVTLRSLEIRMEVDNLLDARADTFAFGNPFMVRTEREYTPLRPRSIRLGVAHRF